MNGILYFSSTGNSLYIAQRLREQVGGEIRYIPKYDGDGSEFDELFLVTPIYSYGMPAHVYDLLPRLDKSKTLTVIQNYGGMACGADYLLYRYATKCGLNVKGVYKMKMPENFTLTFTVPKFYLNAALKKADKRIDDIIQKIKQGGSAVPKERKTREAKYLKNKSNWHLIGRGFSVTDDCTQCGKCVSVCPSANIELTNGKIVFHDKCVACLGCYHRCPSKAIVYGKKRKKDRYVNPNVDESQIGKDI